MCTWLRTAVQQLWYQAKRRHQSFWFSAVPLLSRMLCPEAAHWILLITGPMRYIKEILYMKCVWGLRYAVSAVQVSVTFACANESQHLFHSIEHAYWWCNMIQRRVWWVTECGRAGNMMRYQPGCDTHGLGIYVTRRSKTQCNKYDSEAHMLSHFNIWWKTYHQTLQRNHRPPHSCTSWTARKALSWDRVRQQSRLMIEARIEKNTTQEEIIHTAHDIH